MVDFGTGATDPALPKLKGGVKAALSASVNGTTITLTPQSYDSSTNSWIWSSGFAASIPVAAFGTTSSYPISLDWTEKDGTQGSKDCTKGQGCKGAFGSVQRFTSATDDDDGPVKLVLLAEPSTGKSPYSLQPGSHTLSVTVGLKQSMSIKKPPQLTALRLTGGSRTSGINCDGTGNKDFTDSIVYGCKTPYQVNVADLCPDPAPPPGPADCVPLKTGNLGSTVTSALNQRFSPCPPNNWPNYQPGDRRIVQLMVTDFSALGGSGKTAVPVTNFATFYVMGWSGNNCGDAWPFPVKEPAGGNIWGYFIKYVDTQDDGGATPCDLTSIDPCVPVLTK
jgi:hypothetical protein